MHLRRLLIKGCLRMQLSCSKIQDSPPELLATHTKQKEHFYTTAAHLELLNL